MARDLTLSGEMRKALDESTAAMDQHAVSYALIGGMAASYRSQPRFTKDIDFLVQVPQVVLPQLLEDMRRRGFEFDTLATIGEWTQHHMVTPQTRTSSTWTGSGQNGRTLPVSTTHACAVCWNWSANPDRCPHRHATERIELTSQ